MKTELRFEKKKMRAADLGKEASAPDLLGELILQNKLTFCLEETDEIYEGYGRVGNAYPYRQYNTYTRELSEKDVKTAVLENDYLRAVFLTEYGGRLWELWDKTADKNLLYTNDVLRFSNLAVRNAWFSGGVEWNAGVIGHTPLTTEPLYAARLEMEQSGETVPVLRMYEYERIRGIIYQMDFWLAKEDRALNCRMRVVNESSEVVPMYWWSNMAVPEYEGGRVIVPADEAFTFQDGKVFKAAVPIVKGIDVTDYNKIPRSVDYFFHIRQEEPKYVANVNAGGYGLLQISTKRLQSRKLFSWGNGEASDHWQEFLTDKAGRYLEIQAGIGKTQYGCIPMAPHTAWEWMEQYGPVQVEPEMMASGHKERYERLTARLEDKRVFERLEELLADTKEMAKTAGCLADYGRGYGAVREIDGRLVSDGKGERDRAENGVDGTENSARRLAAHLEFAVREPGLLAWKHFLETGAMDEPDANEPPSEFCAKAAHIPVLERCVREAGKRNWYAWYQLGLARYEAGQYREAREDFLKACQLRENPWGLHGAACTSLVLGENKEAARYMKEGLILRTDDLSFLKEGMKLLYLCGAYRELCEVYERPGAPDMPAEAGRGGYQAVGKLKFYYISALCELGEYERAYGLLEEKVGLEMEDIREGEDSIAQLWSNLHEKVTGRRGKVPYKYNFKAY